jgi:hypothetical protein
MTLHWLSATNLGAKLAAGHVSAREQALYLAGSFVVWLLPGYLFIVPARWPEDPVWFYGLWFYELAMMVLISVAGALHCLDKCRVDARRNFLVDFSCLYLPVSVTTLTAAWAIFYALVALRRPWLELLLAVFDRPPAFLSGLASGRFFQLLVFFAIVGSNFAVFYRIGRHMARISELRQSGAASRAPAAPDSAPAR